MYRLRARRLLALTTVTACAVAVVGVRPSAAATEPKTRPVLLIHGIAFAGIPEAPINCAVEWSNMKSKLRDQGFTDVRTVGYYSTDNNCDINVPNKSVTNASTSITTIAKRFASMIATSFGSAEVDIVGASMGGLITRAALDGVARHVPGFPTTLNADDVVTVSTPHRGAYPIVVGYCMLWNFQCTQMVPNSSFLISLGNNPQGDNATHTARVEWTLIGHPLDPAVPLSSSLGMTRVTIARPAVFTKSVAVGIQHAAVNDNNVISATVTALANTGA